MNRLVATMLLSLYGKAINIILEYYRNAASVADGASAITSLRDSRILPQQTPFSRIENVSLIGRDHAVIISDNKPLF